MFTEGASAQEHIGLSFCFCFLFRGQAEKFSPGSTVISLSDNIFLNNVTVRLLIDPFPCRVKKQFHSLKKARCRKLRIVNFII